MYLITTYHETDNLRYVVTITSPLVMSTLRNMWCHQQQRESFVDVFLGNISLLSDVLMIGATPLYSR